MPATATTAPLPAGGIKKKAAAAGPTKEGKSFFSRTFNVKRFLKTTPLGQYVKKYEWVEDPVGEAKKAVKIAVKDRILFSTFGPYFKEHPIYGLVGLATNAPKQIFELTREAWSLNNTWGYEKHTVPQFTKENKQLYKHLAQDIFQESDQMGRLILKDETGQRLKLPYDRRINLLGRDIPGSQGKGAIKSFTTLTPKAGAVAWRVAGTVVEVLKSGGVGVLLSTINPLLAPLPILLNERILSHLGWEVQGGTHTDKFDLPLLGDQAKPVPGLKVLTEDGREWVLHARNLTPSDIRAKARVFKGPLAPILNRITGASRSLYVLRQCLTLDPKQLRNFGWVRELGEMNFRTGTTAAQITQRSGRLSQFARTLSYLHPANWINGEAFKKLGFAESLVLGKDGKVLHQLLTPRRGFEWTQYLYSLNRFFRDPRTLEKFGWQRSDVTGGKFYIRPTRFAQFNRTLFYLHPRNWLYGSETWRRLGWPEYVTRGRGRQLARTIYNWHPVTLLNRFRNFLRTDFRLLRNLGPVGYLRLKRIDYDNWISLSKNPLARGLLRLRPGFRNMYRDLEGRYAHFVLFGPLARGSHLRRSGLGQAVGRLRNGMGLAGGAVKSWLLAAKKKGDDLWKKLLVIPLKFLLDLLMKLLTKLAQAVASKIGPLISRFIPAGVKSFFAELATKLGAKLAGNAAMGLAGRVLSFGGRFLLKGAFELFSWATAPELQILSYAWRGVGFVYRHTLGRLTTPLLNRVKQLAAKGIRTAARGLGDLLKKTVGEGIKKGASWLVRVAAPAVWGWLTGTALPTLASAASGAMDAIGGAIAAGGGVLLTVAIALIVIIIVLLVIVVFIKGNEELSRREVGDISLTRVTVKNKVQVAVGDPDPGKGTYRIHTLDGKDHLVEFILTVKNQSKKIATGITVVPDAKMGTDCVSKTFSQSKLGPGEEKTFDKCALMVKADVERTESYPVTGTAMVEGRTVNFSDVGILIVGAMPANAPPCGWPASGEITAFFQDLGYGASGYCALAGDLHCSGMVIKALDAQVTDQRSYSNIKGFVSQLFWGEEGGFMKIKSPDGTFEVGFGHLAQASVVPDPATGLTFLTGGGQGLKVGSSVDFGQYVADSYIGAIGHSGATNVFYQVKDCSGPPSGFTGESCNYVDPQIYATVSLINGRPFVKSLAEDRDGCP